MIPNHVWAVADVRHANHGWHPSLTAWLIHSHGHWKWKLQGETAGISVDRALRGSMFAAVPTALEWAQKSKFMRNVEQLREWHDRILIE